MLAVIVGLIFMIFGIWGVAVWWPMFITVLKGFVPVMLVCGGFIAVVAGITSIRDSMATRSVTKESGKKEE